MGMTIGKWQLKVTVEQATDAQQMAELKSGHAGRQERGWNENRVKLVTCVA